MEHKTPISYAKDAGNYDIARYLERQFFKQPSQPKHIRVSLIKVHIKDKQVDVQPAAAQVRIVEDKQIEGVPAQAQVRIEDKQVSESDSIPRIFASYVQKQVPPAPVSVPPAQVHIKENQVQVSVSVPPAQVQGVVFESMS